MLDGLRQFARKFTRARSRFVWTNGVKVSSPTCDLGRPNHYRPADPARRAGRRRRRARGGDDARGGEAHAGENERGDDGTGSCRRGAQSHT